MRSLRDGLKQRRHGVSSSLLVGESFKSCTNTLGFGVCCNCEIMSFERERESVYKCDLHYLHSILLAIDA